MALCTDTCERKSQERAGESRPRTCAPPTTGWPGLQRRLLRHFRHLRPQMNVPRRTLPRGARQPERVPFGHRSRYNPAMNRRLTTEQIRLTCHELVLAGGGVTGRALRRELEQRYGSPGSTSRVFRIWREVLGAGETRAAFESQVVVESRDRVARAERLAAAAEQERLAAVERAQRAELREVAHQERWAREVDELRVKLAQTQGQHDRVRHLEELVLKLNRDVAGLRGQLLQAHQSLAELRGQLPAVSTRLPGE